MEASFDRRLINNMGDAKSVMIVTVDGDPNKNLGTQKLLSVLLPILEPKIWNDYFWPPMHLVGMLIIESSDEW